MICENCLINTMCLDTCEKFKFPRKNILYYLKDITRQRRLINHHKKKNRNGTYKLNETERVKIFKAGHIVWYDDNQEFLISDSLKNNRKRLYE